MSSLLCKIEKQLSKRIMPKSNRNELENRVFAGSFHWVDSDIMTIERKD